ncbi:hypothetical protein LTR37_015796 [Vermiconidia calcicola]|uniref:Uncharacterized protein n=1 Tax=Vermiconidia calcicola TaxID=1690605 RepID=A0ACC3MPM6_9PEZI|nr:hypothetical protein LTR37_015796 [Vermiconidia calcicola]
MSENISSGHPQQGEACDSAHEQPALRSKDAEMSEKDPSTNDTSPEELENGSPSPSISETQQSDHERDIVFWDGPADSANPLNWSTTKKGVNLSVLSAMTFLTPLASSFFAPGIPELMREFGSDSSFLATFVVSVYILGWALGPLVCYYAGLLRFTG